MESHMPQALGHFLRQVGREDFRIPLFVRLLDIRAGDSACSLYRIK
jgi:hypothetical protein